MCVRGNRGRRAENGTQIGHLNGEDSGVNFVQWNEEAYLRALMEGKEEEEEEEEEERSLCIFIFPTFPAHHAYSLLPAKYRIISPKAKRDYFFTEFLFLSHPLCGKRIPPLCHQKNLGA